MSELRESEEYAAVWDLELWKAAELAKFNSEMKAMRKKAIHDLKTEALQQRKNMLKYRADAEAEANALLEKAKASLRNIDERETVLHEKERLHRDQVREASSSVSALREDLASANARCAQLLRELAEARSALDPEALETQPLVRSLRQEVQSATVTADVLRSQKRTIQTRAAQLSCDLSRVVSAVVNAGLDVSSLVGASPDPAGQDVPSQVRASPDPAGQDVPSLVGASPDPAPPPRATTTLSSSRPAAPPRSTRSKSPAAPAPRPPRASRTPAPAPAPSVPATASATDLRAVRDRLIDSGLYAATDDVITRIDQRLVSA